MADLLSDLPVELVKEIASKLPERDLKSLSLVSKFIHNGVESVLWHSVTIAAKRQFTMFEFSLPVERVPEVAFQHLREVTFRLAYPDPSYEKGLLPYFAGWGDGSRMDRMEDLSRRVLSVLNRLKDGQLKSFSWRMHTRIPNQILGHNGILRQKHSSIRHLSLLTDYRCREPQGDLKVDLSSFGSLLSLNWSEPHPESMSALAQVLRINAPRLREVYLDFGCWEFLQQRLGFDGAKYNCGIEYFATRVLQLQMHESSSPFLGNICTLSLKMVPLVPKVAHQINFSTLRNLSIRTCRGWGAFIKEIAMMEPVMTLRFFEVQDVSFDHEEDPESCAALEAFLQMFHGLEGLVICSQCSIFEVEFWQKVAKAHPDMRCLVYEHGLCYSYQDSPPLDEDQNLDPRWLDGEPWDPSQNPWAVVRGSGMPPVVAILPLEFLGACIHPQSLFKTLDLLSSSRHLRILHLRCTHGLWISHQSSRSYNLTHQVSDSGITSRMRNYFYLFLEAAFGPQSPPSLEAIASDEFHDVKVKTVDQAIFYRNRGGEEVIQQSPVNYEQEDLISRYWDKLMACSDEKW